MNYQKLIVMLVSLTTLSGCFGLSNDQVGLQILPPDTALTERCASPIDLPIDPTAVLIDHWAADRASLALCRDRHAALVEFVEGVSSPPDFP